MEELQPAIQEFIESQLNKRLPSSRVFRDDSMRLYLRAGPYHCDAATGVRKKALGIASIDVSHNYRGKGLFRDLIVGLEQQGKTLGYEVLRVEQVHNETLLAALKKHGYVSQNPDEPLYVNDVMFKVL